MFDRDVTPVSWQQNIPVGQRGDRAGLGDGAARRGRGRADSGSGDGWEEKDKRQPDEEVTSL